MPSLINYCHMRDALQKLTVLSGKYVKPPVLTFDDSVEKLPPLLVLPGRLYKELWKNNDQSDIVLVAIQSCFISKQRIKQGIKLDLDVHGRNMHIHRFFKSIENELYDIGYQCNYSNTDVCITHSPKEIYIGRDKVVEGLLKWIDDRIS